MKSVVTFAGDHADLASANRRTFLMQAATSVGLLAAGMVLDAATPVQAKSQPAKGALVGLLARWDQAGDFDFDAI